jgi:hypothetical protein
MNRSKDIRVPRCCLCGQAVLIVSEPFDCIVVSATVEGSGVLARAVHWRCLESAAPEIHVRLHGEYERILTAMARARISRGLPADPRMN